MKLLENRASAPGHCEHCDDEIEHDEPGARFCDRCEAQGWWRRLSEQYENGDGVWPMGGGERWSWGREFYPLRWALGIRIDAEPDALAIVVHLGPWSFYIGQDPS